MDFFSIMLICVIKGSNHRVLAVAENTAWGTDYWSPIIEAIAVTMPLPLYAVLVVNYGISSTVVLEIP